MAINVNDDYDKLVKLFYPSLEASGNIYYGQTRKLTMDEILGKNDMGFESHIESEKQDGEYCKFFNWKIGPLHGSVRVGDLETFPLAYAKYKLVITNRTVENHLNSTSFPTYENEIACIFDSIAYTTGNPVDESESWDGRHFYVDDSGTDKYLYIALVDYYSNKKEDTDYYKNLLHTPLCISLTNGPQSNISISLNVEGELQEDELNDTQYWFSYDGITVADGGTWDPITLNSTVINLSYEGAQRVYIVGHRGFVQNESKYIHFECITSSADTLEISGNINSLLDEGNFGDVDVSREYDFSNIDDLSDQYTPNGYLIGSYTFYKLFANSLDGTNNIYGYELLLPAKKLINSCYSNMFYKQFALRQAPDLPAVELAESCYESMFAYCDIATSPKLYAISLRNSCYKNMFTWCSRLGNVKILASDISAEDSLSGWLQDVSSTGILYYNSNADDVSAFNIPSGWDTKDLYEEIKDGEIDEEKTSVYRSQYMITSGSDSDQNGKGKLDGSGECESSFDEYHSHPMGSYNSDGSYNQEIWGYKSFNSPVQFRNGIYGDSKGLYISGNTELSGNLNIVGTVTADSFETPDMSRRFVTVYNKDDTSIGDDQTILGVKTFDNDIKAKYIISRESDDIKFILDGVVDQIILSVNSNDIFRVGNNAVYVDGAMYTDGSINITEPITCEDPYTNNQPAANASIGTQEIPMPIIYCTSEYATDIHCSSSFTNSLRTDSLQSYTNAANVIALNSNIVPKYDNTYSIGDEGYRIKSLYTSDARFDTIHSASNGSSVTVYNNIIPPRNSSVSLGTYQNLFDNIWSRTYKVGILDALDSSEDIDIKLKKTISPNVNSSISLGNDSYKFRNVYANNFVGNIPYAEYNGSTRSIDVPIGSFICVDSTDRHYNISGSIVDVLPNTVPILHRVGGLGSIFIPEGRYVVIAPVSTIIAILMRIE